MSTKKISELLPLTPDVDLSQTIIPVVDQVSGTTRKISLQDINDSIEASIPIAESAYDQANTAITNATTADQKAVSAGSYANSAFDAANNSLNVLTGGTVTGDLTLTGNLSITGWTVSLQVSTLRTNDKIIDVAFGSTGYPLDDAGFRVLRGD